MNKEMMMQAAPSSLISASSSLNSFSSSRTTLADVAARVAAEFRLHEPLPFDWYDHLPPYYEHEDEEVEFSFVCGSTESSSLVPADEIFHNGKIKPIHSFIDSSAEKARVNDREAVKKPTRRPQLRVLMSVDRAESESSCLSSEADDLDIISPGTYCVWKPDAVCKKSRSAGESSSSSRRWKLRQLILKCSSSDGAKAMADGDGKDGGGKAETDGREKMGSYSRRKSFLPYRKGLVGFPANVNGLNRNLRSF